MDPSDSKANKSRADDSDDSTDYVKSIKSNREKAREAKDRYNAKYCSPILPPPPHPDFELHPDDVELWKYWEQITLDWPEPHEIPDSGIFEVRRSWYPAQPESQPQPQRRDSLAVKARPMFGNHPTHQHATQDAENEPTVEHIEHVKHKENYKASEVEELLRYMRLNDPKRGGAQPTTETNSGIITPPATPQPEPTIHSPTAAAAEALRDNSTHGISSETP